MNMTQVPINAPKRQKGETLSLYRHRFLQKIIADYSDCVKVGELDLAVFNGKLRVNTKNFKAGQQITRAEFFTEKNAIGLYAADNDTVPVEYVKLIN